MLSSGTFSSESASSSPASMLHKTKEMINPARSTYMSSLWLRVPDEGGLAGAVLPEQHHDLRVGEGAGVDVELEDVALLLVAAPSKRWSTAV